MQRELVCQAPLLRALMYELEGKDWKKPQYYSPCLIKMRGEFQASVFLFRFGIEQREKWE